MRLNFEYFEMSICHPESIIDPMYHLAIEKKVIPKTKEIFNALTTSNTNVIKYVTTIETLITELGQTFDSEEVLKLIRKIIAELDTEGMNYSALCQYFNVHNMNYSIFAKKTEEERVQILKLILDYYIQDRHQMYLSHGYSHMVLQVMCDCYSHKRKGSYGAKKIEIALEKKGLVNLANETDQSFSRTNYFLLADKTGKKLFLRFAEQHNIRLSDEGRSTKKLPDALIKIGHQYFIVEQKNMKEDGGGQDKQTREITDFIFRKPEFKGLHYITYMDGCYVNTLTADGHAKKFQQRNDILTSLKQFPENYFVNDFGFNELMNDAIAEA